MNQKENYYLREQQSADDLCRFYFDMMYRILQFSFVAIVSLIVAGYNVKENSSFIMIFCYFVPICNFVFGIMYCYNAYALSLSGAKAEKFKKKLNSLYFKNGIINKMEYKDKYVLSQPVLSILAYGTVLGLYITLPILSYLIGAGILFSKVYLFKINIVFVIPIIAFLVYILILILLINELYKLYKAS